MYSFHELYLSVFNIFPHNIQWLILDVLILVMRVIANIIIVILKMIIIMLQDGTRVEKGDHTLTTKYPDGTIEYAFYRLV